ncbi:hypothetical protein LJC57_00150 [Parabacteroides sp. OttesenSCG-928-G07]|nr:hypothetical protein [Parabacteroides sp. OttesenSCG-928-G07]
MNMKELIIYVDMDNVLVDFQSGIDLLSEEQKVEYQGRYDEVPNIFSTMKPMPGAIEAMHRLCEFHDVFILSTAPWENPSAWADKLLWVKKYLGDVCYKRLILSHHKNLLKGHFLIDDRNANGVLCFGGVWIHFGSKECPNWDSVLKNPILFEDYSKIVEDDFIAEYEHICRKKRSIADSKYICRKKEKNNG